MIEYVVVMMSTPTFEFQVLDTTHKKRTSLGKRVEKVITMFLKLVNKIS